MSEIDLLYTELEEDVRSAVRAVMADGCTATDVIRVCDGDQSVGAKLWKSLRSDLGFAALLVPEDKGGAGASAREAAVVLEELGRAAAPVPFLTSAIIATTVLLDAPGDLLAELASGARTAALAVPFSTAPNGRIPAVDVAGGRLTGAIASVAGALEADILLVPAESPGGMALYAVPTAEATVAAVSSLDMTRQLADLTLDLPVGEPLIADAEAAIRAGLLTGAALLASEQVGIAQWCLTTTVAYLKERRQFGRVLGGFQALKHRLADVAISVELATSAARYAAATLAAGDADAAVAAAMAQSYCSDVAVAAAEEAVQLHGGIGMTWEYPVHVYLKRAKADQIALGTAEAHRVQLAELIDLR